MYDNFTSVYLTDIINLLEEKWEISTIIICVVRTLHVTENKNIVQTVILTHFTLQIYYLFFFKSYMVHMPNYFYPEFCFNIKKINKKHEKFTRK